MNNLSILRKRCLLSQEEFAKKLNVSQSTVSYWEQKKSLPKLPIIKKIAEVLQVDVNEILNCFIEKTEKEN